MSKVPTQFRWIRWNREHATKHGCTIAEIESVVRRAMTRMSPKARRPEVGWSSDEKPVIESLNLFTCSTMTERLS